MRVDVAALVGESVMSEIEIIIRSAGYTLATVLVIGASIWYGWELREKLAIKLDYFRISPTRWHEYDEELRANKGKLPKRAQIHDITEHERQSTR